MRLRLWHASDGARVAYREAGTGPAIVLLHSVLLTHREFEPVVEHLSDRFRVVLPDLPAHGDSEDRPRHPYTLDWLAEVMAAFCAEVGGPGAMVGGHDAGAEILLHAGTTGRLSASRLVVMPTRLHRSAEREGLMRVWRAGARAGGVPGLDRLAGHATRALFPPALGSRLSSRGGAQADDLVRHAVQDVPGNANLARSRARLARHWPRGPRRDLLDAYAGMDMPVMLLWADEDPLHPLQTAEEALGLLPRADLRVLAGTGFLLAYDDPVGVARELAWFFGATRS